MKDGDMTRVRDLGQHAFKQQKKIVVDGQKYHADGYWKDHKVVFEWDSTAYHGATCEDDDSDHDRKWLKRAGKPSATLRDDTLTRKTKMLKSDDVNCVVYQWARKPHVASHSDYLNHLYIHKPGDDSESCKHLAIDDETIRDLIDPMILNSVLTQPQQTRLQ